MEKSEILDLLRKTLSTQSKDWLLEENESELVKTACFILSDFLDSLDLALKTEKERLNFIGKAKENLGNPDMLVHVVGQYIESQ